MYFGTATLVYKEIYKPFFCANQESKQAKAGSSLKLCFFPGHCGAANPVSIAQLGDKIQGPVWGQEKRRAPPFWHHWTHVLSGLRWLKVA